MQCDNIIYSITGMNYVTIDFSEISQVPSSFSNIHNFIKTILNWLEGVDLTSQFGTECLKLNNLDLFQIKNNFSF